MIQANKMHYSQIYFGKELHVSDRSAVHHQESQQCIHKNSICHASYVDCLLADANRTSVTNTYCCVYTIETPDDGQ